MSFVGIAIGGAAVAAGSKIYAGVKQGEAAKKINPQYTPYETSDYAKKNLGYIQNLMNGRMVGAASAERNIAASQANQLANVSRNATDASTALALGAAAQGQADSSYENLQAKEGQQKYGLLDNLQAAYKTMINEDDKIYQDKFRKYELDSAAKQQLKNASLSNITGGIGDVGSAALGFASMGLGGNSSLSNMMPSNLGQQQTIGYQRTSQPYNTSDIINKQLIIPNDIPTISSQFKSKNTEWLNDFNYQQGMGAISGLYPNKLRR